MKLYLQQHAEACAKEVDPERPLSDKGRQDVSRLADFLGRSGVRVARVVHSGKLRAAQTAQRMAESIASGVELETSQQLAPNDDPRAFRLPDADVDLDMLVVGHLPYMAKLVSYLLINEENQPLITFQPGAIVCLARDADEHWQLCWMITPELAS